MMLKKLTAFLCTAILILVNVPSLAEVPAVDRVKTNYQIPENEAMAFADAMGVGWNLGNTFDAIDCSWLKNELEYEKAWCGVYTTREDIAAIRAAGFGTVRIPVSWHNHVSGEDFIISEKWLDRVQTVVDWALEEGMYVILNSHHDMDKRYCYPSSEYYEVSERYMSSVWRQIAERFAEHGDHLIFESMNEPRLAGTSYEWNFVAGVKECKDAADCINRLNQVFVNTVRAAGGKNADRFLMVPAYAAAPQNAANKTFILPEDTVEHRLMVSVHAYTPYDFALQDGATKTFDPTKITQTAQIDIFMNTLFSNFIHNGIPVVIGEYGARDKGGNLQERVNFTAYYVASARTRGIPCVWWDNGGFSGTGELFGLLDRTKAEFKYPEIVEAIMTYKNYGKAE